MVAQRIERRDREAPRRAGARFDQLREHQRGEVRHVLGEVAQRRQAQRQLRRAARRAPDRSRASRRALRTSSGEKHTTRTLCFSARASRNSRLRCSARPRRVRSGDEQDAARRLRQQLRRRLARAAHRRKGTARPAPPAGARRARARMPRSPRSSSGAPACASWASRFFASASAARAAERGERRAAARPPPPGCAARA